MKLPLRICLAVLATFVRFHQATAAFWTIIDYVAESLSIDDSSFTFTSSIHWRAPVTSPPTASATSTSSSSDVSHDALYLTKYINAASVPPDQLASASSSQTDFNADLTITNFYQQVIYTAPANCPSSFQYTTSKLIYAPLGAETNLNPTSTTSSRSGTDVFVTGYLTPNAVPSSLDLVKTTDYVQNDYINLCSNPSETGVSRARTSIRTGTRTGTSFATSTGLRSGGDDDFDDDNIGCIGSLCPFWLIYIVIIVPILALLILFGFIESYFWFSRLMQGRYALRGVPIFWICISLWTLLCLRTHRAAQPDEQSRLQKQWREMSFGQKFSLWMKYGFRHRDPPELGTMTAPGVFTPPGQPPQMMQQGQPMYYQPPPPPPGGMYYPQQQPGQPPPQPYYQNPNNLQPNQYGPPAPRANNIHVLRRLPRHSPFVLLHVLPHLPVPGTLPATPGDRTNLLPPTARR